MLSGLKTTSKQPIYHTQRLLMVFQPVSLKINLDYSSRTPYKLLCVDKVTIVFSIQSDPLLLTRAFNMISLPIPLLSSFYIIIIIIMPKIH
jgi:hypothetical protein